MEGAGAGAGGGGGGGGVSDFLDMTVSLEGVRPIQGWFFSL